MSRGSSLETEKFWPACLRAVLWNLYFYVENKACLWAVRGLRIIFHRQACLRAVLRNKGSIVEGVGNICRSYLCYGYIVTKKKLKKNKNFLMGTSGQFFGNLEYFWKWGMSQGSSLGTNFLIVSCLRAVLGT